MKETLAEKITLMLQVYRLKLEKAEQKPVDHLECIRLESKISVLEDLEYYANLVTE
jgi:hypothetical protein